MPEPRRGQYIVFEGGEGTGKSTQAQILAQRFGDDGLLTREPGATPIGVMVRDILLDPSTRGLSPRAETLLMAADRAQHYADVIEPALDTGTTVISDRSLYSSVAYQGYGRQLDAQSVMSISQFALESCLPDVVILLTVSPEVRNRRLAERGGLDRFELAGHEFHQRVEAGFQLMAQQHPKRWWVVDGEAPVRVVAAEVLDILISLGRADGMT